MPAPKKNIDTAKLRFLIQRREEKSVSQIDAARYFGLQPSARNELRDWESGVSVPPTRHRPVFIRYLIDKLGIRDREQFNEKWKNLAEQWEWEWKEITDREWQEALVAALPLDSIPEPAALPPGSRIRFRQNPLFVGREADLRRVAATLKGGGTAAIGQVTAATGLGGIGKTQLAAEFVHRYGPYFTGGVFWLSFADATTIPAEIAECGGLGAMNLPSFNALQLDDQVELVRQAWRSPVPRLLVFDNCEDEALLDQWRPESGGCRVLVTSRRASWDAALGVAVLPLDVLQREESIALLRKFRPDLPKNDPDLDAIATELGDLPLALHLAGSYLTHYKHIVAPAVYLQQVRSPDLLQHRSLQERGGSPTAHIQHVGRTFQLSYARLDAAETTDDQAIKLLARAAYFAPGEPIPRNLLRTTLDLASNALLAEDALTRLVQLGLLEESTAGGAVRLHRLLAAFVRSTASDGSAQTAVEGAIITTIKPLNETRDPTPYGHCSATWSQWLTPRGSETTSKRQQYATSWSNICI